MRVLPVGIEFEQADGAVFLSESGTSDIKNVVEFSRSMVPSTLKSGRAPLGSSPVICTSTVTVPFCTAGSTRITVPATTPLWVSTHARLADLHVARLGLGESSMSAIR